MSDNIKDTVEMLEELAKAYGEGTTINTDSIRDAFSKSMFGVSYAEAIKENICLKCKKSVEGKLITDEDRLIYNYYAFCPHCHKVAEISINEI